ncbi:PorV/PorQ family protein [candidate division KSB1 bacterium]|nr:PorV/PorQ family protein [candidate division KSB1 bacterium]
MKSESQNKSLKLLILLIIFLICGEVYGQIRAGAAFLKMMPGARMQAMAGSYAGGLDETYALFANPGATGFLREWHWAVSYNKWIADIYNASLIYGQKIKTPWSRKTQLALGVIYYGVPEFNSADHNIPQASANDLLASLSIGQPISFLSERISLGANVKYYRSKLYTYEASTFILDAGFMARTPKFNLANPLFENGILSAGFSVTQLGENLKFDMVGTPLPRTWRVGAGFYLGKHNGFQLRFISDYRKVRDEKGAFGIGAEFSYNERFSLSSGYNFSSDLLKSFSFGISIRLDDITTSEKTILPGRNKALQFDIATLDADQMFSRTYRGDAKYFPISPEAFRHYQPDIGDTVRQKVIVLNWEKARDPDLFDDVKYTVVIDRDSLKLAQLLQNYEKSTSDFWLNLSDSIFQRKITTISDSVKITPLEGGCYYWLVSAFDLDNHVRFAEISNRKISKFYIPEPVIEIKEIAFDHDEWITTNDYQGNLKFKVKNSGNLTARRLRLVVKDSILSEFERVNVATNGESHLIGEYGIDSLGTGQSKLLEVAWNAKIMGEYRIHAEVLMEREKTAKLMDEAHEDFYTIPKGTIKSSEEVVAMSVETNSIEIPLITQLSFNQNSAVVKSEYLDNSSLTATLFILSQRLKENRHLGISIKGYADPNSGETDVGLANSRSEAVREALLNHGVLETQIYIVPGEVLEKRKVPANPTDAEWIFEERRHVDITTNPDNHELLFGSVLHSDTRVDVKPVLYHADIEAFVSFEQAIMTQYHEELSDIVPIAMNYGQREISNEIVWNISSDQDIVSWLDRDVNSYLSITDSLGRTFRSKVSKIRLEKKDMGKKHRISFPLKFAKTEPIYDFYWQKLYQYTSEFLEDKNTQMYFTGHACAVGPERVNNILSKQRAKRFHKEFLKRLKSQIPDQFVRVTSRIAASTGYGESRPLSIETLNGERIIIGNNATSHGRKLNRRIELVLVKDSY